MCEFLPQEVVEEILHRLPVKSIGKCMSVCKSWNIMIKSHSFIFSHLSRPSLPLFHVSDLSLSDLDLCTVHYSLYSPKRIRVFLSVAPNSNEHVSFIGSSNGLVCLSVSYIYYNISLWNPVTRKHLQLPNPPNPPYYYDSLTFSYGFGFDSKNNDFKVVRLYYPEGRFSYPPKVELYSLNEGAWRDINASHIKLTVKKLHQHSFLNGNVHWLATRGTDPFPRRNDCILMFDMVEEKFNTMELPEQLNNTMNAMPYGICYNITVIDGCFLSYTEKFCTLWGVSTRSEILVFPSKTYDGLRSFDLKSQEIRDIGIKLKITDVCSSDFKPSMVLLDKDSYDGHSVRVRDNESSARCKCWGPNSKLKDVQHVSGRGTLQRAWFYLTKKAMSLCHCEAKRMNRLEGGS
ncbi:F-box/kelch-repeat protein At3g23880-like [Gastrolobium bilobum]|uniref:F-box/kelch-repeat protein At3g23880-like n=1 Tax=Gastrolobium bilobum TaxID=150636 RepID=UPI002AB021CF|nr:F-box/kelch-repeat protein At3g23880-like [Gastrolobium bilobum]